MATACYLVRLCEAKDRPRGGGRPFYLGLSPVITAPTLAKIPGDNGRQAHPPWPKSEVITGGRRTSPPPGRVITTDLLRGVGHYHHASENPGTNFQDFFRLRSIEKKIKILKLFACGVLKRDSNFLKFSPAAH